MRRREGITVLCLLAFLATTALWATAPKAPEAATTTRDAQGVWSIQGDTIGDVFEAEGYAVAQDRLWQMELYLRTATGRLSEIFGPSQLETDMLMRTMGYTQKELKKGFKKLSKDAQAAIDGYVAGINRRVDDVLADPTQMPFEYLALSATYQTPIQPQHWTRYDVMSWMAVLQRRFDPEALETGQLENYYLLGALEENYPSTAIAMFGDMRWLNDPEAQTYIPANGEARPAETYTVQAARLQSQMASLPNGTQAAAQGVIDLFNRVQKNLQSIGADVHMGSYAWVVSGSKTADGNPILYSGPQMGFDTPSITVEGAMKCPTYNVSGMTVPGIPGIILGRTPHHAWSMQVGHGHTTDYYVESPLAAALHHKTVIHVLGGADVKLKVYRTSHGPVINPMPYDLTNLNGPTITWKNSHWKHEWEATDGIIELARATSMDDFGTGIDKVCMSEHFCYADKAGNIAYWMSGWDPVRPANVDPRLPIPGDFEHEWTGALKPRSTDRNTAQGYYCGWNNKSNVNYDNAPNNVGFGYGPFHRAHVIDDYLRTHNGLTYEQVRDLAVNIATTYSSFTEAGGVPWSKLGPYFAAAVQAYPNPNRMGFLGIVQAWDGHYVAGGPGQWATGTSMADGWLIEDTWVKNMVHLTFDTKLGPAYVVPDVNYINILIHALEGTSAGIVNQYNWFQDPSGSGLPTDPQQLIVLALDLTMQQLGAPPYNQPRGVITFTHAMLGPIHSMPFSDRSTFAHCVEYDASGAVRLESMFPLGESGFIGMDAQGMPVFDPNFFGMAPFFDTFTLRDVPPPQ